MPKVNVEWVELSESMFAAFNERDLPRLVEFFHEDAVLREQPDFSPNPGTYRGRSEILSYWESYDRVWADFRIVVEEFRSGRDKHVAFTRVTASGRTSGAPIETPVILTGTVRDGKLASLDLHLNRARALEAAGLSE